MSDAHDNVVRIATLAVEAALATPSAGQPFIPFFVVDTDGEPSSETCLVPGGAYVDSMMLALQRAVALPAGTWAVASDGIVPYNGQRTDAVVLTAGDAASPHVRRFAQPYRPTAEGKVPLGPLMHGPTVPTSYILRWTTMEADGEIAGQPAFGFSHRLATDDDVRRSIAFASGRSRRARFAAGGAFHAVFDTARAITTERLAALRVGLDAHYASIDVGPTSGRRDFLVEGPLGSAWSSLSENVVRLDLNGRAEVFPIPADAPGTDALGLSFFPEEPIGCRLIASLLLTLRQGAFATFDLDEGHPVDVATLERWAKGG